MLARRAANPAVRTARARRDPAVSYVPGWAPAPDIGRALLTILRTVAGLRDRAPRPWSGSWTEPSVQPVRSGPSAARLRGIRAASAHGAPGRVVLLLREDLTRSAGCAPSLHLGPWNEFRCFEFPRTCRPGRVHSPGWPGGTSAAAPPYDRRRRSARGPRHRIRYRST
jgi:hypothetical protein